MSSLRGISAGRRAATPQWASVGSQNQRTTYSTMSRPHITAPVRPRPSATERLPVPTGLSLASHQQMTPKANPAPAIRIAVAQTTPTCCSGPKIGIGVYITAMKRTGNATIEKMPGDPLARWRVAQRASLCQLLDLCLPLFAHGDRDRRRSLLIGKTRGSAQTTKDPR